LAASTRRRHGLGAIAIVGGPGVPDVDGELDAVAACYGGPGPGTDLTVLRAGASSVEQVLAVLGRADVAHLAAHGRFRGDSPMFSSLAVADGPLTVHDLDGLPAAPSVVVLSACDVGRSEVRPGDEVQGVVSVLLGLGTATLVASVLPVPHGLATEVTVGFHRRFAAGIGPARALADAVPDGERTPFLVFGSG
jgi:CHAT domain-containing protein